MNEATHIAIIIVISGAICGLAGALYNHVRECRRIHHMLGRIMERLKIPEET